MHSSRLRAFLVVADELNFTRAARRLHVSQQGLSSAISRLERDLDLVLFDRSTRSVSLTPGGRAFVGPAQRAVAELDRAVAEARRAGREATGVVRVGAMVGVALELTDPILDAFAAVRPEVDVQLEHHLFDDPSAGLRNGSTDVAFVRRPLDDHGLTPHDLLSEPLVAVVRTRHRLAARDRVDVAALRDETVIRPLSPDAAWNEFWSGGRRFDATIGARTLEESLELAAAGRGVLLAAAGWVRFAPRKGLVGVPVEGLPRSVLAIAAPRGRLDAQVRDLVRVARATVAERRDLVAAIEQPFA